MFLQDIGAAFWSFDPRTLVSQLTWWDVLGLTLAAIATLLLSVYFVLMKHVTTKSSSEALFFMQIIVLPLTLFLPSILLRENYGTWLKLEFPWDWVIAFATLSVYFVNLLQIMAIKILSANVVGCVLAVRLVAAVTFAWILLGEKLINLYEIIGCILVMVTITLYLVDKAINEKKTVDNESANPILDAEEMSVLPNREIDIVDQVDSDPNEIEMETVV